MHITSPPVSPSVHHPPAAVRLSQLSSSQVSTPGAACLPLHSAPVLAPRRCKFRVVTPDLASRGASLEPVLVTVDPGVLDEMPERGELSRVL